MLQEPIVTWISADILGLENFSEKIILFVGNSPEGIISFGKFNKQSTIESITRISKKEKEEILIAALERKASLNGGMILSNDARSQINLFVKTEETKSSPEKEITEEKPVFDSRKFLEKTYEPKMSSSKKKTKKKRFSRIKDEEENN